MGILGISIIILEDYIVDPLIGIVRIGRYNRLAKRINKVSLRQTIISIRYRQSFRYYKHIDINKKGTMP